MSDRATLLDLAVRVEKAQGADRAMDYAVAAAFGWPDSPIMHQNARRYTESLDAAAALVPEGWTGMVHLDGKAGLYRDDRQPTIDGSAATPALALTAAALRARAEEATDGR